MEWLVQALAFQRLDSVNVANDGLDTLFERLEVRILRQALKRVGEVDAGVLERHLGEHLGQGAPAKLPSLIGQISRSTGAELLQGLRSCIYYLAAWPYIRVHDIDGTA